LGELCDACQLEIAQRAGKVSRWVSLVTPLVFGVYVMMVLPPLQMPRLVGGAATLAWFLLVRRIARQLAAEWFRTH